MRWPDVLFREMDGTSVALVLLVIAAILAVWGAALVRSAHLGWPGRWPSLEFEFWTGLFLIGHASLYLLLAIVVVNPTRGIDVWVMIYFSLVAIPGVVAFYKWARSRL